MILLALIKDDDVELDKVAVEVREVFDILDVALEAVKTAVAVLSAAWVLFYLYIT